MLDFSTISQPLTQGSSSGTFAQRDIERPMESHRSSRRHEDEYHEQQQGRVQYQQQRYPPPPLSSDRYDSRRAPSPPRSQQQQQHRQASNDANRRVSSGSTHDWADDDDGEMNFNEPLLIVSNRSRHSSSANFYASVSHLFLRSGLAMQVTPPPRLLQRTILRPNCSKSR